MDIQSPYWGLAIKPTLYAVLKCNRSPNLFDLYYQTCKAKLIDAENDTYKFTDYNTTLAAAALTLEDVLRKISNKAGRKVNVDNIKWHS